MSVSSLLKEIETSGGCRGFKEEAIFKDFRHNSHTHITLQFLYCGAFTNTVGEWDICENLVVDKVHVTNGITTVNFSTFPAAL